MTLPDKWIPNPNNKKVKRCPRLTAALVILPDVLSENDVIYSFIHIKHCAPLNLFKVLIMHIRRVA